MIRRNFAQEVDMRRTMLLGTLVLATASLAAQELSPTPAPPKVNLTTDADRERFLLQAVVVRRRSAPGGITNSERATLRDADGWEHDAHIQRIDQYKVALPVGATRAGLPRQLSQQRRRLPPRPPHRTRHGAGHGCAARRVGNASFTWWVDDVMMDEKARHAKKIRAPRRRGLEPPDVGPPRVRPAHLQLRPQPGEPSHRQGLADLDDRPHACLQGTSRSSRPPRTSDHGWPRELLAGMRRLDQPDARGDHEGPVGRTQIDWPPEPA